MTEQEPTRYEITFTASGTVAEGPAPDPEVPVNVGNADEESEEK